MKKIVLLTGIFLTSVVMVSACGKKSESPAIPQETPEIAAQSGETLSQVSEEPSFSNFKSVTLGGEEVNQDLFADYNLTMVNVWATFCGPCLREMPDLGEIHEEYKEKGFQIVGIVSDVLNRDGSLSESQLKTAREIVEQTGAGYVHMIPSYDLQMAKLKDVTVVPTTFFLDKDGNLVGEEQLGSKSKEDWMKLIDEYLKEVS